MQQHSSRARQKENELLWRRHLLNDAETQRTRERASRSRVTRRTRVRRPRQSPQRWRPARRQQRPASSPPPSPPIPPRRMRRPPHLPRHPQPLSTLAAAPPTVPSPSALQPAPQSPAAGSHRRSFPRGVARACSPHSRRPRRRVLTSKRRTIDRRVIASRPASWRPSSNGAARSARTQSRHGPERSDHASTAGSSQPPFVTWGGAAAGGESEASA